MSRKCGLTGKIRQRGNRVSHAKNRNKHSFDINVQNKKIFVPSLGKTVKFKLSAAAIRTIDKIGIEAAMDKYNLKAE